MAKLVDYGSDFEPINGYPNPNTRIELDINLVKNDRFVYDANDPAYRNWIPFEFKLQVGEDELYEYPAEFGATFNVEELNNWFLGMEKLFNDIQIRVKTCTNRFECKPIKFKFFTLETYFGMDFSGGYEEDTLSVTVWIIMGSLPNSDKSGFRRGFGYTVTLEDVKIFMADLKKELDCLIESERK